MTMSLLVALVVVEEVEILPHLRVRKPHLLKLSLLQPSPHAVVVLPHLLGHAATLPLLLRELVVIIEVPNHPHNQPLALHSPPPRPRPRPRVDMTTMMTRLTTTMTSRNLPLQEVH